MDPSHPPHLSLPAPPPLPPPYAFPVLASAAPVVGAMVMWAVTHSVYLLGFAFLGPVIALGSFLDAKWKTASAKRRGTARFAAEVAAARLAIDEAHQLERTRLRARTPSASRILASPPSNPERWRGGFDAQVPVTIGSGTVRSTLVLDPNPSGSDTTRVESELRGLRRKAEQLEDAPVVVDAADGIGVCGPGVVALAVARGIILQLADALSPAHTQVEYGARFEWMADLPHPRAPGGQVTDAHVGIVRFAPIGADDASPNIVVAVAERAADLPRHCRVVLDTAAPVSVVSHPDPARCTPLKPEAVTEEQARDYAALLRHCAHAEGILAAGRLPVLVKLAALPQRPGERGRSLACAVAAGHDGVRTIDLVADGPHAVIGGTTGSGKSELLISWVLAMAGNYDPGTVNFLLVDFKGGSSFAPLVGLPHCVGVITDLDERSAARALESLRAELRFRERALARRGVRAVEDLVDAESLPRLVIVIDEFAAVLAGYPELHGLFADVAARGRSLGVHLILCTQRPAGAVRDAVMANCTLRICLRVNNTSDSVEAIGTGAAADLSRVPLGRGFIRASGERPQLVQFALSASSDVPAVARWPRVPVRRPWCDPLPAAVDLGRLPARTEPGIGFALADLPEQQRQSCAVYDPDRHGNLLVIGAHGSGKSTVLAALQAGARGAAAASTGPVQWVPATVPDAWDCLTSVRRNVRQRGGTGRLLLLDDVDALLDRFPEEYQRAFVDLVIAILREGGGGSVRLALTAQRLTAALQSVAALCDARMLLRLPDRQEHVAAGGTAADFVPEAVPGSALWRGHRVQVATVPVPRPAPAPELPPLEVSGIRGLIAVSGRPGAFAQRLRQHPHIARVVELAGAPTTEIDVTDSGTTGVTALVADPETWQSRWSLLEDLRQVLPMLFEGGQVAEFRAVTRLRTLPPPLEMGSDTLWLKDPGGSVSRVRL